jgi:hypothetical protein
MAIEGGGSDNISVVLLKAQEGEERMIGYVFARRYRVEELIGTAAWRGFTARWI